ncbi:AMP-dependent synthetase and ligase [Rubrobacter xylanophilus DSM 9941]|uniref:AMP-dependent synthetase and ligase n=1 Tax=Rubrobacter xylanophilus (strain DSM 9941 / JCM 11954 / NBRC 16129 / PRD-1) TaxID=266117 RepID=Q1ATR9_RUBXD|nr:AMP-binding protein [Rubrobacter xylanophilus]ABG05209.1 AMP-dependent synthetase and ligase [Rubrobacter xylanophilus DSM 9941]
METYTAHLDTFARDNLPPREAWPEFVFDLPELSYPERLNAAAELLDKMVSGRPAVHTDEGAWSYRDLLEKANRISRVLTEDMHLVPGNRVLLRAPNTPMLIAAWFAVLKAGGIVVATMPLLRKPELLKIIGKAQVTHALTDTRLTEDLEAARAGQPVLENVMTFGPGGELEERMASKPADFETVETAAEDVAIIAFTSGTTGEPKGCMHSHRDLLAVCDTFGKRVLKAQPDEVFTGTPPLAFTYGLGGYTLFPMRAGASVLPIEKPGPDALLEAIERRGATTIFTAPTGYRALLDSIGEIDASSLRKCVSAGEPLPAATSDAWFEKTGVRIIDGIGSTEMLHIFISASGEDIRPGSTGKPVPGYRARVVADDMSPLPPGEVGKLAVKGPTGCRYLADPRQADYVVDGWNITGDSYRMDEDGYFWFQARTDDMIISAGYNISGPEVEAALLGHRAVSECAVVASPDEERGNIVKAFVVLREGASGGPELVKELQDFVKGRIAPYKYPRAVEFVDELPKTQTGKIQRFKLRELEKERAAPRGSVS